MVKVSVWEGPGRHSEGWCGPALPTNSTSPFTHTVWSPASPLRRLGQPETYCGKCSRLTGVRSAQCFLTCLPGGLLTLTVSQRVDGGGGRAMKMTEGQRRQVGWHLHLCYGVCVCVCACVCVGLLLAVCQNPALCVRLCAYTPSTTYFDEAPGMSQSGCKSKVIHRNRTFALAHT